MIQDDDLQFELSVEPRLSGVEPALKEFTDSVDAAGKQAGQRLSNRLSDFADLRGATEEAVQQVLAGFAAGIESDRAASMKFDVASADPALVKEQVAAIISKERAQRRYNEALEAEQEAQRGPVDYRQKALDGIRDRTKQQEVAQKELAALDDPSVLKERLALAQQLAKATEDRARAERDDPARTAEVLSYKRQIADLEHQGKLSDLADQLDPDKVKQYVVHEQQLLKLERQLADAREDQRKSQPTVALDFRAEVLKQESAEIARQTTKLERQRILLDPDVLAKRLALEKETSEVRMARLRAEADPTAVEQRVRAAREEEALRKKIAEAEGKERHRQDRPGFIERLVADPSKAIGGGLDNLKSMFSGEDGEGVGGTADMLLQTFKGGLGEGFGKLWDKFKEKPLAVKEREVDKPPTEKKVDEGMAKGIEQTAQKPQSKIVDTAIRAVKPGGATGPTGPVSSAGEAAGAGETAAVAGGGMELAAAAGPVGLAVVAGMALVKAGAVGAGMATKAFAGSLSVVDTALTGMAGTLGPIGAGLDLASAAFSSVVDTLGAIPLIGDSIRNVLGPLAAVPGLFKSITETLTSFAAKASPATFTMFQHAVDDAQAVIGQRFVPVLELMTDGVRLFADVLTTLLPTGEQVRGVIGSIRKTFDDLDPGLRGSLGTMAATIRGTLTGVLEVVGRAVSSMAPTIVSVLGSITSSLPGIVSTVGGALSALAPIVTTVVVGGFNAISSAIAAVMPYAKGFIDLWSGIVTAFNTVRQVVDLIPFSGLLNPLQVLGRLLAVVGTGMSVLGAVIGGIATAVSFVVSPITEGIAEVKSAFGEVSSLFSEAGSTIFGAIKELFSGVGGTIGPILQMLNPLRVVGDLLKLVATGVKALADRLRGLLESFGLVGARGAGGGTLESSVGAAARPAQYQDSDRYREALQLGAYSQGTGPTQADLPTINNNMLTVLTTIKDLLSGDLKVKIVEDVTRAVSQAIQTPQLVGSALSGNSAVSTREALGTFLRELMR